MHSGLGAQWVGSQLASLNKEVAFHMASRRYGSLQLPREARAGGNQCSILHHPNILVQEKESSEPRSPLPQASPVLYMCFFSPHVNWQEKKNTLFLLQQLQHSMGVYSVLPSSVATAGLYMVESTDPAATQVRVEPH